MNHQIMRFVGCVALILTLVACGGTASSVEVAVPTATTVSAEITGPAVTPVTAQTNAPSESSFATPISNQVEVHDESTHEGETHDGDDAHSEGAHKEGANGDEGHDHTHLDPALATAEMQVALVPSELVVGLNRFAVGLYGADRQAVNDAVVHFHYYDLTNPNVPVLESHAQATLLQTPDGLTTIFAQDREFTRAGEWGVEVQAEFPDGSAAIKRIGFQVLADSASPIPGETAPSVDTAVSSDVDNDLTKLTSALTPNPAFYQQSLADAMSNGKPTVLLFATPAFCQTRFCGPAYDIATELQAKYGDQVNFVHVEIYTGLPEPAVNNWELAPAMTAFGLSTEPWIFLIDGNGVVVYRVEGLFTVEEVAQLLPALLES